MPKSDRMKWVHRVGYATTAIVGAQLLFILGFVAWGATEEMRTRAEMKELTRTHERPLNHLEGSLGERIPPLSELRNDGLRFFASPSVGPAEYGLAVWKDPASSAASAILVMQHRDEDARLVERFTHVPFEVPEEAYRTAVQRIDALAVGFDGEWVECFDGTPTSFERVNGTRITSGGGSGCSNHYSAISAIALGVAKHSQVPGIMKLGTDWMPPPPRRGGAPDTP